MEAVRGCANTPEAGTQWGEKNTDWTRTVILWPMKSSRVRARGVSVMPDRQGLQPSLASEMPPPSAELTILAVILRTHLRGMKPAKRREFMRGLVATLEEFESDANVVRLRGREFDVAVAMTRKQSVAWLRGTLAAFFVSECERL